MRLVLASTSPIRRALLARLKLPFECIAPSFDEEQSRHLPARTQALSHARGKAEAGARLAPDAWVLAADQLAVCEGRLLYKPGSEEAAIAQLCWMRGRVSLFFSAVALRKPHGEMEAKVVETAVRLRKDLSDDEIAAYVRCERPVDSAGAFYAEGLGIALFSEVKSTDPTALLGLPLMTVSCWLAPLQRLCQRSNESGQGVSSSGG